jgi:hypothetical protein
MLRHSALGQITTRIGTTTTLGTTRGTPIIIGAGANTSYGASIVTTTTDYTVVGETTGIDLTGVTIVDGGNTSSAPYLVPRWPCGDESPRGRGGVGM